MPPKLIRKNCANSAEGEKLLETAIQKLGLSARAPSPIWKQRTQSRQSISAKQLNIVRWTGPTGRRYFMNA
jgi:hypothetical protein